MQKPLSLAGQGFAVKDSSTILQQTSPAKQLTHNIVFQAFITSIRDDITDFISPVLGTQGDRCTKKPPGNLEPLRKFTRWLKMTENINARVSPPAHQSKKACISSILAISPPTGQSNCYKRLTQAIRERELTIALEILDASGISGDVAMFVLSNLQSLEVAR